MPHPLLQIAQSKRGLVDDVPPSTFAARAATATRLCARGFCSACVGSGTAPGCHSSHPSGISPRPWRQSSTRASSNQGSP
jgi:hypothetical protein